MTLTGKDSSVPQPTEYAGTDVWGIYVAGDTPHIWTREEVAALGAAGVKGVLPIVVPPVDEKWWSDGDGAVALTTLVMAALAWGIPAGSPLVLDVEQAQATQLLAGGVMTVGHAWAVATRGHGLDPWIYSNDAYLRLDSWSRKWLADWTGTLPDALPAGYSGQQYAGNVNGGEVDLDLFADGVYLDPTALTPVTLPGETAAEKAELPKVESATAVQTTELEADAKAGAPTPADKAGVATLIAKLKTHLNELEDLLDD
jgi:hypothetical protein